MILSWMVNMKISDLTIPCIVGIAFVLIKHHRDINNLRGNTRELYMRNIERYGEV